MKQLIFIFAFYALSLNGAVQDYFKKIPQKPEIQCVENIDYIYVINLDQRPEKFEGCVNQLLPYGIELFRFSAVNGWELTLENINDVGIEYRPWMQSGIWGTFYPVGGDAKPQHEIMQEVGKTYFSHCMSRGAIGICLSHLSVLQDAYDSGFETIWVMEDDIEIITNPHILAKSIANLDSIVGSSGWDVLFTDQDTKNSRGEYVPCWAYAHRPNYISANPQGYFLRKYIGHDLRQIGARYGAYSMIVRRSGMEKILNFFKTYKIFLPYDIDFNQIPDIRLFTVLNDVVSTQIDAPSDNGNPNYDNKL